ncbi:hypothetical protein G6M89_01425 [Natronolimnobius sp. AArcel1]|uniref:hypothetical protein n=1 Tax=Natronolimnobius sp. AArcel1 TaxID=1679093 RepID=UPI0013EA0369|nr:hypothetical protein [Natronolimnobius sp. AArcel1]NGM67681.1 hypothetical protein [Natronolimnobius sp. AArcel1]
MGDKNFTLIELHLDGNPQFGPRTITDALPFGDTADTADEEADTDLETETETDTEFEAETDLESEFDEDDDSSGKGALGAVVALTVLVVAGVAVKKFRGGEDEPEVEADEEQPDVIVN